MRLFDNTVIARVADDREPVPVTITVDGKAAGGKNYIVDINGRAASGVQLDRTFGGHMLVTAFGEAFEAFTFTGFTVDTDCDKGGGSSNGLDALYRKHRAGTNKTRTPVIRIAFGSSVFRGIVNGMQLNVHPNMPQTFSYTIQAIGSIE